MSQIPRLFDSNELAEWTLDIHSTACDKGWWPYLENPRLARGKGSARMTVFPEGELEEKFVLIATELAEAMEEYRLPDVDLNMIYYNLPSTSPSGFTKIPHEAGPMTAPGGGAPFKPEGFAVEMADAYIRILDLMGALNSVPEPVTTDGVIDRHLETKKVGVHLFGIFHALFEPDALKHPTTTLSWVLMLIERACTALGADLAMAIQLKTTYNKTRSARHGNKKA